MASGAIPSTKNDQVRASPSDNSAGFLEDKIISSDGSVDITTDSCGCAVDLSVIGVGGFSETWIKAAMTFADFNTASASVDFTPTEFTDIAAGSIYLAYKIKHSVSFTGGSVASANIRVDPLDSQDVFIAPSPTVGRYGNAPDGVNIQSHSATFDLPVTLVVTGDTCDNLTAGEVEIWIKIATLL